MDYLQSLITQFNIKDDAWVVQVFIIIFLSLLINVVQVRLLNRIEQRLSKNKLKWDDAIIFAIRRPLSYLIWILGITFATDVIATNSESSIFSYVGPLREVGVIVTLAWVIIRFINIVESKIAINDGTKDKIDKTTADAISKLLRMSVMITTALVVLQTFGFSISGVLAFGGIGGLAVGFAAKDMLSNFFGGFMIYMDRPFSVGDWIRSPDRNIEGTVEKIGWRLTCIRTFDKRPLYIPNSTFTSIAVENPSRMSHRRIYETFGIRYDDADKLQDIILQVKDMLRSHPEIEQNQTMIVNFNKFAASSLDFFIYTFTKTTDWIFYHEIKQDVLLKINEIVLSNNAEMAFPTSTVHLPDAPQFAGLNEK
ncbi:Mechanosensitive ion channel [hydrothermal vent metagenome]|uniref:Mechanosensitive ion channel n=1 Tax=hydrothermal vent metagenome TaxID=652676 RepID=A0A3B1A0B6_9ZZZZ